MGGGWSSQGGWASRSSQLQDWASQVTPPPTQTAVFCQKLAGVRAQCSWGRGQALPTSRGAMDLSSSPHLGQSGAWPCRSH